MIAMDKFYLIGGILFTGGTIGTVISSKITWGVLNIGSKLSAITSVLTQILFTILFFGLYFQIKKQNKLANNPAVDEFIKELQKSPEESNNKKDIVNNSNKESIFNTNMIKKSILHGSENKKNNSKNKFKSEQDKYNYIIT